MASNQFLAAAKKLKESKNMDELLVGSKSTYLPDGKWPLTIISVDTTTLKDNYFRLTVANDQGKELRDTIFLTDRESGNFSNKLRYLLSALFGHKEVYPGAFEKFVDQVITNQEIALEMLTGMKFTGETGKVSGYNLQKVTASNLYVPFDVTTGEPIPGFESGYESIEEAKTQLEAAGLKRAFSKITRTEAQDESVVKQNYAALCSAIEGREKAKAGNSSTGATNTPPVKRTATLF